MAQNQTPARTKSEPEVVDSLEVVDELEIVEEPEMVEDLEPADEDRPNRNRRKTTKRKPLKSSWKGWAGSDNNQGRRGQQRRSARHFAIHRLTINVNNGEGKSIDCRW